MMGNWMIAVAFCEGVNECEFGMLARMAQFLIGPNE